MSPAQPVPLCFCGSQRTGIKGICAELFFGGMLVLQWFRGRQEIQPTAPVKMFRGFRDIGLLFLVRVAFDGGNEPLYFR